MLPRKVVLTISCLIPMNDGMAGCSPTWVVVAIRVLPLVASLVVGGGLPVEHGGGWLTLANTG